MSVSRHIAWVVLLITVAACVGPSSPHAYVSPSSLNTSGATGSTVPISPNPTIPPQPSLTCPGQYQAGHSLLTALLFTQGYGSLAVLDISDPLAPSLVCTVNNSPYPVQPIQWLSRSEFVLVLSQPNRLLDVDVARRSITTLRELNGSVFMARLSPDRAWLATMEGTLDGARMARLYGPSGEQTLAAYPMIGGHGGTIYGFGGPSIGFSADGSLVLAVDYAANVDPTISDLQVFDLKGSRIVSAAKGIWATWVNASLYFAGGDQNVYRWARGAAPVAVLDSDWLQPTVSPDGQSIAYLTHPGYKFNLDVLDTRAGNPKTLKTTGQRIYPLFVTSNVLWAGEVQVCDNCFGGATPTGKVFAYDLATGAEHEVRLPELLGLAGASRSSEA